MRGSARKDRLIGATIDGRYTIVRKIGKGGMGSIYEASHSQLGRSFALKTLSQDLLEDAEALARFRREAEVVTRLRHPNIVDVVDWVVLEDGSPGMVMELLEGETLAERLERVGKLEWDEIGWVLDQVLSALSVAHNAGVVHRDLKPHNIFLARTATGEEQVKLLDFGVSKIRHSHTFATTDARLLGTPAYMSPEQADGRQEEVATAADVWALGAILYEMAAGEKAFTGRSLPSILYMVCHGEPKPLESLRPDTPRAVLEVAHAALTKDPAQRIQTAGALRDHLRTALGLRPGSSSLRMPTSSAASSPQETAGSGAEIATTLSRAAAQSVNSIAPQSMSSVRLRPRRTWLVAGLGAAAVALAVIVVVAASDGAPPGDAPAVSGDDEMRAAGIVDAQVSSPGTPSPQVGPGLDLQDNGQLRIRDTPMPPDAAPSAPEPEITPAPETVTLRITSVPSKAAVYNVAKGKLVGFTPYKEAFEREPGIAVFKVQKKGYAPETVRLRTTESATRKLTLHPVRAAKSAKRWRPRRTVTRKRPKKRPPKNRRGTSKTPKKKKKKKKATGDFLHYSD